MDDLMPHIDRRPEFLERLFDNLNRAFDARAKTPRLGQKYLHERTLQEMNNVAPKGASEQLSGLGDESKYANGAKKGLLF
jgi:hypothetical protein